MKHILVKQLASCLHKGSRQAFYHPCIILFFVWMNELWPHNFHLFSYPQFNAHFLKTLDNEVIKHLLHSQTFGMHILFRSCGRNTHSYAHTRIHMNACTHRMAGIPVWETLIYSLLQCIHAFLSILPDRLNALEPNFSFTTIFTFQMSKSG